MSLSDFLLPFGNAFVISAFVLSATPSLAETNSWINPTSGDWQDATSWSLGILPDSSQSVAITNSGEKTVTINTATVENFTQSLTVNSLLIGATNILVLDNSGTNIPLVLTNGLRIAGASPTNLAAVINLNSGLVVENGSLDIVNGRIIQNGGFINATNGTTFLNGYFYLTNGLFEAGAVSFGLSPTGFPPQTGFFYQYGGAAAIANLSLDSVIPGNTYTIYDGELRVSGSLALGGSIRDSHFYQYGGRVTANELGIGSLDGGNTYILYNGELVVTGRLSINGIYGAENFLQDGGTNCVSELEIGSFHSYPKYTLNGGLLCASNVMLEVVGYASEPVFEQNGGIHIVTNTLTLIGWADRYGTDTANYFLTDGYLSAGNIVLQASIFHQANSTTSVSGTFQLGRNEDTRIGLVLLDSGTLRCANVSYTSAGSGISQNGGEFIVTNLFSFGGRANWIGMQFAKYYFSGGTLTASNIELAAEMIIGSSTQTGRITNPGYFKMSGTLTSGDATEQLGRFILASNSVIDLGDGSAKLSFANSSAEIWDEAAKLFVTNWNGSLTGGGDDQLKFGTDASGLTSSQLNQIRFENPAGFPSGEFLAQILNTGEVVPKAGPTLSFGQSGTNFILSWNSDFVLQTATNVIGPYEDVSAASPYTNDMTGSPQRFFRLRE